MPHIYRKLSIIGTIALVMLMVIQQSAVYSQLNGNLQPSFGPAIAALHRAESSGASSSDISNLVTALNQALELNREALKVNTAGGMGKTAALLAQVDQILANVESRSIELTVASSQRRRTNEMLTYVWGMIAALIGTLLYVCALSFNQKYRIKRTFNMKVSRK